jgi:hypothetical protein
MMRRLFLLCVALSALAEYLAGQKCPVQPAAQPYQQEVPGPNDHFEWYSAYAPDAAPGNGNDFDRHVRNLGGTLLKYDWPVGRMYNYTLPTGQSDSLCVNYGRANSARGPINHGRLNDSSPTSVWEGENEPPAKNIVSRFIFFFSDKGGDPEVGLTLESTFDGKIYSYSLTNSSRETIRVSWQTGGAVNLFQELQTGTPSLSRSAALEFKKRTESMLAEQLKKGRTLEPGQIVSMHAISAATPKAISTNLDVGTLDGRPLAGAILFILVPGH